MEEKRAEGEMPPGFTWRIAVSAVVGIAWLIFVIIFLFFYATDYGIYKTIAILLVSLLIMAAILSPIWIPWGIRTARKMEGKKRGRPSKHSRPE